MEDNEKPNYYAIIPASLRYNPNLSPNEKLLFGEITALSNKEGFCWANNTYFAKLYSVDARSVTRWISNLARLGFIRLDVTSKHASHRKIWITEHIDKIVYPHRQKCAKPSDKNVQHNNTRDNNTPNTINSNSNSKRHKYQLSPKDSEGNVSLRGVKLFD